MMNLSRSRTSLRVRPTSPSPPPLPPDASVGKRWRFRRNLVIYLSHRRLGFSQRFLADVFDLPRSRIAAIVGELEALDPDVPDE